MWVCGVGGSFAAACVRRCWVNAAPSVALRYVRGCAAWLRMRLYSRGRPGGAPPPPALRPHLGLERSLECGLLDLLDRLSLDG